MRNIPILKQDKCLKIYPFSDDTLSMRAVRNHLSILLVILYTYVAYAGAPNYTTFQTKIISPSGLPLENSAVNFRFTILDTLGTCVLYIEDYTAVNMTGSSGVVSFSLGSGVKTYPGTATLMSEVFSNSVIVPHACQAGGTYAPGTTDRRQIVMQFNDGSGWQTLPQMAINSVFYANYATTSEKLGNYVSTDYLRPATLPSCVAGQALHYNGTSFTCVAASGGAGVTSVNVNSPLSVINTTSTPVISLAQASGSTSGYLSSADWSTFNSKASATLTSGNLYIGNASNAATGVTLSGDATLNSSGDLSLKNSGVASGTYGSSSSVPSIIVDAKGRVISATSTPYQNATGAVKGIVQVGSNISVAAGVISLSSADVTAALTYTPISNTVQVFIQNGNSFGAAANIGTNDNNNLNFKTSGTPKMTVLSNGNVGIGTTTPNYNLEVVGDVNISGNFKVNGTNIGGGGVTSVNGSGPISVVNTTNTPVISIATANGTTTGALSSGDWSIFNNKMNNLSSDITTALGYTPLNRFLAPNFIFVGSAGSVASAVAMSGDASIVSSGNITLTNSATTRGNLGLGTSATFNVPVAGDASSTEVVRGTDSRLIDSRAPMGTASGDLTGSYPAPTLTTTGVGAGTYTKVTVDTKGRVITATNISSGDLTILGGFSNGGNSFGANASIGTNDNFDLSFKTNNSTQMSILANGNVGIGTTTPAYRLDVIGDVNVSGNFRVNGSPIGGAPTSLSASAGSAGAPSISFSGDATTGLYKPSAGTIGLTSAGANIFNFSSAGMVSPTTGGALVQTANGTSSTPTYSFAGDSDTGWFRPAADTMAASTGGLERMRIDSAGNVGIGTAAPVDALSIGNVPVASATRALLNLTNSALSAGSVNGTYLGANPTSATADFVNFQVNGVSNFKVGSGGAVAASSASFGGTIAPLVVTGTSGPAADGTYSYGGTLNGAKYYQLGTSFYIYFWGSNWYLSSTLGAIWPSPLWFLGGAAGSPALGVYSAQNGYTGTATVSLGSTANYIIDGGGNSTTTGVGTFGSVVVSGNVGIGTTTPSNKLEVAGSIRSTAGAITSNISSIADLNVNFGLSNVVTTSASCGAVTLTNMQDGGSYTLVVAGTSSGTCIFTHSGVTTYKFSPANGPTDTASSGETVYTFLKVGAKVYVSWITGMR